MKIRFAVLNELFYCNGRKQMRKMKLLCGNSKRSSVTHALTVVSVNEVVYTLLSNIVDI